MPFKWYVIRVQSGKEEQVAKRIEQRVTADGLDTHIRKVIVPIENVTEIKNGQRKIRQRKLYPGYIMAEMDLDSPQKDYVWFLIKNTHGVGDFVGPHSKPVPMSEPEAERILMEMNKTTEDAPKLKIEFKEGDSVKIKEGPFENFDGVVEELYPAKGLVKVTVTIFGRATPVELEYWQIEPV